MISRRTFVGRACAAVAFGSASLTHAEPLGLPLGLQLYSVRKQLADHYEGTLGEIGGLGYREVEAAGFYGRAAKDVKQIMAGAKLHCVSAHYPFPELHPKFDETLEYCSELGVGYLICSSPGYKSPPGGAADGRRQALTLEDWRYNAEQFNLMGRKCAAASIRFGYHNHVGEFAVTDAAVPYLELLRLTDPALVTMELDCGWATVAGMNPVDLLRDHPKRFSLLHVKDFKRAAGAAAGEDPTVTELGMGSIDYRPIFAQAAKTQKIRHMFIEQEAFDMPYLESLKVDAEYMRHLKV